MTHIPSELGEGYLAAAPAERPRLLSELVRQIKAMAGNGESADAYRLFRTVVIPSLDYTSAQSLMRAASSLKGCGLTLSKIRIAILGGATTDQLGSMIQLYLLAAGVEAEIYLADYGVFRQEILDPSSGLYEFQPQFVFIATTWRDLGRWPSVSRLSDNVNTAIEAEATEWMNLWRTVNERLGCQVIQNNFDVPPWRQFANHEMRQEWSPHRFIANINQVFADRAPAFVTIHDLDYLAASAGRWAWDPGRFFHHAKIPCSPERLVEYGHSVASLVLALLGMSKKCLVLDLDNTLWGGVVGDDGIAGIRLGQGDAEGEAYLGFQRYLKNLRDRGVLLAVCSKNDQEVAREVFLNHPEMVLRLDDISCFIANWDDKASNLRRIASSLILGQQSLVFVDDNPMERALVRQLASDVSVPEMPADPADYVRTIDSYRYFQLISISKEDFERTAYYQANARRAVASEAMGSVDEFLKSLEMTSRLAPIISDTLERAAQLINKSNQFNLTTRRRSAAEVLAIAEDSQWATLTATLKDRFGDNGLVSVVLTQCEAHRLVIDTWLMSCRVLKRGLENAVLNHLVALARRRGLTEIVGDYLPTPKNALVADHYERLGFELVRGLDSGGTRWVLAVRDDWKPLVAHITVESESDHA